MKLSIVIPAYNEETRLYACLFAIAQAIRKATIAVEVIVVNNASTDKTREVAESFPWVTVIDESQKGIVCARAAGYRVSHGELIANVDADTLMPERWIVTVIKEFSANSRLVALSGPYLYTDLSVAVRAVVKVFYFFGWISHLLNQYVFKIGAMLQGGNFVLKRTALEQIGGFDTTIAFYGEDTDIARRIFRVGEVKWTFALPMETTGRRLREQGVFRTGTVYAANYLSTTFRGKPYSQTYSDVR